MIAVSALWVRARGLFNHYLEGVLHAGNFHFLQTSRAFLADLPQCPQARSLQRPPAGSRSDGQGHFLHLAVWARVRVDLCGEPAVLLGATG